MIHQWLHQSLVREGNIFRKTQAISLQALLSNIKPHCHICKQRKLEKLPSGIFRSLAYEEHREKTVVCSATSVGRVVVFI